MFSRNGESVEGSRPVKEDPEQSLKALAIQDDYAGYVQGPVHHVFAVGCWRFQLIVLGRMGRGGRAFFDVYWKEEQQEEDEDEEEDEEDIDLSPIDRQFELHQGLVGRPEPVINLHAFDSELVPG